MDHISAARLGHGEISWGCRFLKAGGLRSTNCMRNVELCLEAEKRVHVEHAECYLVRDRERKALIFLQNALDGVAWLMEMMLLNLADWLKFEKIPWEASFAYAEKSLVVDGWLVGIYNEMYFVKLCFGLGGSTPACNSHVKKVNFIRPQNGLCKHLQAVSDLVHHGFEKVERNSLVLISGKKETKVLWVVRILL